jgi:hypothetical protein
MIEPVSRSRVGLQTTCSLPRRVGDLPPNDGATSPISEPVSQITTARRRVLSGGGPKVSVLTASHDATSGLIDAGSRREG